MSGPPAWAGAESAIAAKTPATRLLTTREPSDRLPLNALAGGSFMRLTRFAVALAVLVGMASVANAETVMKQCGEQWQAAKTNGTTNGETWPQYLKQCRAQLASTGGATTHAAGRLRPGCSRARTRKEPRPAIRRHPLNAMTSTLRTRPRSSTQVRTKREFVAACRAGNDTTQRAQRPLSHRQAHCFLGNSPRRRPRGRPSELWQCAARYHRWRVRVRPAGSSIAALARR